jgi:hypothetical protein
MVRQGQDMFSWIPNAYVKYPCTAEGFRAARRKRDHERHSRAAARADAVGTSEGNSHHISRRQHDAARGIFHFEMPISFCKVETKAPDPEILKTSLIPPIAPRPPTA